MGAAERQQLPAACPLGRAPQQCPAEGAPLQCTNAILRQRTKHSELYFEQFVFLARQPELTYMTRSSGNITEWSSITADNAEHQ